MIREALTLCEPALRETDPIAMSASFHAALLPHGVTYLQIRRYLRPPGRFTSRDHWNAGGFVARFAPPDWIGRPSSNYVCFDCNPLIEPISTGVTRFRFGDYAPHHDRNYGRYWDAMSEGRIGEALAAVAYGRDRNTASLHIGFEQRRIDNDVAASVHTAGAIVAEALLKFPRAKGAVEKPMLSTRERDAIAYVAEGKTDWELAMIMAISESTARFHVDNARRKLGAVNRAHAVARFIAMNGPA